MEVLEKLRALYDGRMKQLGVDIPNALHSEIKKLCVEREITMAQFAIDALEVHLELLRLQETTPSALETAAPPPPQGE